MKRKWADYPNWESVLEKEYKNKYFNNDDFKGNISLLTAKKVKEKLVADKDIVIMDDGFKWLEIYPDDNKNIAISVCFNTKNEILKWYFDIAKNSGLADNGIPYIDDLYLDVILKPNGDIIMLDEDELQEALESNDITQNDYDLAYTIANKLINDIDGKLEDIITFTYKYFNLLND